MAAIVAVVLAVPALLGEIRPSRQPFNERPLRALEKAKPQVVFVGDSMLGSRLDPVTLNGLAGGRCEVVWGPGASSAVWYLMMKNLIAVQSPPPRTVVIFFRDRQLTLPAHRTSSGYRSMIESYMRGEEPLLEKLVEAEARRRQSWLKRISVALYPLQKRRDDMQEKIHSWALDWIASSREYVKIRDDAKELFDVRNLRRDRGMNFEAAEVGNGGLEPEGHEFGVEVGRSFLPAILEIARGRGIDMVFFEVKSRPHESDLEKEPSPDAVAYQEALRAYLEKAGANYIDEGKDPEVTADFYGSDDHVAPAMKKAYTELFWRKMAPRLLPGKGAAREQ